MSTYAIADAINKLADNIKYAIGERNQIEKDKLAFEKEKFEFEKKKEQYNKELQDENLDDLISNHIKNQCNHNWKFESYVCFPQDMCYMKKYVCSKCGETKTEEEPMITTT